ncbi:unnamed protein product [Acanthosepion pharaonis]|uniref:Uncharacterized protein n=1 Tax=Acanthosepion pharaonis TaxID=158019 RepID=A0A812CI65_ACAPH|nr:unnamed protein product [Sepia pharaonis]
MDSTEDYKKKTRESFGVFSWATKAVAVGHPSTAVLGAVLLVCCRKVFVRKRRCSFQVHKKAFVSEESVWVKNPHGRCTTQFNKGTVTQINSPHSVSVDGIQRHIKDVRPTCGKDYSVSNHVSSSSDDDDDETPMIKKKKGRNILNQVFSFSFFFVHLSVSFFPFFLHFLPSFLPSFPKPNAMPLIYLFFPSVGR